MAAVVKVAESCGDRLVTGRSAVSNEMPAEEKPSCFANFTVTVPWSEAQLELLSGTKSLNM